MRGMCINRRMLCWGRMLPEQDVDKNALGNKVTEHNVFSRTQQHYFPGSDTSKAVLNVSNALERGQDVTHNSSCTKWQIIVSA